MSRPHGSTTAWIIYENFTIGSLLLSGLARNSKFF
jgi:hypothetical protein